MTDFQTLYTSLRIKEGRNYSDEQIRALPKIAKSNSHYNEWRIREKSAQRMVNYLQSSKFNNVVEVGCGIGWFSNYLAINTNVKIVGIDIHAGELDLARQNFIASNLTFAEHNIIEHDLLMQADCILINGAIQYFKDLDLLFKRLAKNLTNKGEIHIIDSPIHNSKSSAEMASIRTKAYYEKMGVGELHQYFNHHCISAFPDHTTLYSYGLLEKIRNKLGASNSPFPWIKIDATALCF